MAESNSQATRCPCGFFGSAQTLGLCSKCYNEREQNRAALLAADSAASSSSSSGVGPRGNLLTSSSSPALPGGAISSERPATESSSFQTESSNFLPPASSSSCSIGSSCSISSSCGIGSSSSCTIGSSSSCDVGSGSSCSIGSSSGCGLGSSSSSCSIGSIISCEGSSCDSACNMSSSYSGGSLTDYNQDSADTSGTDGQSGEGNTTRPRATKRKFDGDSATTADDKSLTSAAGGSGNPSCSLRLGGGATSTSSTAQCGGDDVGGEGVKKMKNEEGDSVTMSPQPALPHREQKNKNRCFHCNRKLTLAHREIGKCKCEYTFCSLHRLPEQHSCSYDHKEKGRAEQRSKMISFRKNVGTSLKRLDQSDDS